MGLPKLTLTDEGNKKTDFIIFRHKTHKQKQKQKQKSLVKRGKKVKRGKTKKRRSFLSLF